MPIISLELVIEILTFGIVVFGSIAVVRGAMSYIDVRRRLGDHATMEVSAPAAGSVVKSARVEHPFLLWVHRSSSLSDNQGRQKLRKDLALAGFDLPAAPVW